MPPRNELCPCSSGKKYKLCCLKKDRDQKHADMLKKAEEFANDIDPANASEKVQQVAAILKHHFEQFNIIDLTKKLTNRNYEAYQRAYYNKNMIMIVEKLPENAVVFESRCIPNSSEDIMLLCRGSYRLCKSELFGYYLPSLREFFMGKK